MGSSFEGAIVGSEAERVTTHGPTRRGGARSRPTRILAAAMPGPNERVRATLDPELGLLRLALRGEKANILDRRAVAEIGAAVESQETRRRPARSSSRARDPTFPSAPRSRSTGAPRSRPSSRNSTRSSAASLARAGFCWHRCAATASAAGSSWPPSATASSRRPTRGSASPRSASGSSRRSHRWCCRGGSARPPPWICCFRGAPSRPPRRSASGSSTRSPPIRGRRRRVGARRSRRQVGLFVGIRRRGGARAAERRSRRAPLPPRAPLPRRAHGLARCQRRDRGLPREARSSLDRIPSGAPSRSLHRRGRRAPTRASPRPPRTTGGTRGTPSRPPRRPERRRCMSRGRPDRW